VGIHSERPVDQSKNNRPGTRMNYRVERHFGVFLTLGIDIEGFSAVHI
jgi:hypothetical protein